jgi:hypothetical protein
MKTVRPYPRRSGNILVLTAAMLVVLFGLLAFAVDLGYLEVVRTELQRSADAAAIAATWELIDPNSLSGHGNPSASISNARTAAGRYTGLNLVGSQASSLAQSDIVIGQLANPSNPHASMTFNDPTSFNAVQIQVRRARDQNGEVPLFFARVLGLGSSAEQAHATAAFLNNIAGFRTPPAGTNLGILPFALDKTTWDALLAGNGTDNWKWDEPSGQLKAGSDGILEANLYPQGTGAPGNRGTVDIGNPNNSTADIARQILHGVSAQDLEYLGGSLQLDAEGHLTLQGDPGISAGVKDELASIKGQPKIIPVFDQINGSGNNARYRIVQFAGVRIMDVKLTGSMSSKRVIIQPANVLAVSGVPAPGSNVTSHFVYSPVWLVR